MISGITKVSTKTLIHIDALEALYSKISKFQAFRLKEKLFLSFAMLSISCPLLSLKLWAKTTL